MSSHKLEVFTDYVCPWCYLGDSRVKKLKKIFNIDIQIIHFPLHPDTPKEGKSLLDLFGTNQEDIDKKNQNMKNFIKLFVIMYFLSGFVINFVKQPLNSNNSDQEITTIQYKIRSGDTLWDIADNYNPSNKENFINELMIINNLDSYLLEVNKILVIPINI